MPIPASTAWQKHPGLVWSNPAANDSTHIRAALLRPRFGRLLDIALDFGLERLQQEWKILQQESGPEAQRAAPAVGRILTNIQKGFALAPQEN